jgi:predicted solute-binding protein
MSDTPTLQLLFDDTPTIAPLALALELGWATLPATAQTLRRVDADVARSQPEALVLASIADYAVLQDDYVIIPELACGGHHNAGIVLIGDRRLDEIDDPLVDLADVSRGAELLTRATLLKFYGMTASAWLRDGDTPPPFTGEGIDQRQTIEIREGGEALHLLDAPGDAEVSDLGRSWFILTGLPPVTHLLLAPKGLLGTPALTALVAALPVALAAAHERRRELRRDLAERYGISRELLSDLDNDKFLTLTGDAQKSLLALFPAGAWGMDLPTVTHLNLAPWAKRV